MFASMPNNVNFVPSAVSATTGPRLLRSVGESMDFFWTHRNGHSDSVHMFAIPLSMNYVAESPINHNRAMIAVLG
jgi:hypothetical protein